MDKLAICNNHHTPMAKAYVSFDPTPFPPIASSRLVSATPSRLACLQTGDLGYPLPWRGATAGGMKLSDYLIAQQLDPAEFARRIGVGRMSVHRYIRGERFPRPEVLQRIHQATAGQVTPNDFLALTPAPSPGPGNVPGSTPGSVEGQARREALPTDSGQQLSDDEELIGRPLYPWSRLQADEQQVLDDAYHDMMDQPPEGMELSPTVQTALETLGDRASCCGEEFTLDGKVTRIVRLIEKANALRAEQNLPPLKYPGVRI
ncbi:MAG: helix-turn-helix transcriptional regulator [Pseudomonadota bacterium]